MAVVWGLAVGAAATQLHGRRRLHARPGIDCGFPAGLQQRPRVFSWHCDCDRWRLQRVVPSCSRCVRVRLAACAAAGTGGGCLARAAAFSTGSEVLP